MPIAACSASSIAVHYIGLHVIEAIISPAPAPGPRRPIPVMIFTPRPLSDPEATDLRMALSRIGQMPPCPQGDPVAAAVAARIDSLLR